MRYEGLRIEHLVLMVDSRTQQPGIIPDFEAIARTDIERNLEMYSLIGHIIQRMDHIDYYWAEILISLEDAHIETDNRADDTRLAKYWRQGFSGLKVALHKEIQKINDATNVKRALQSSYEQSQAVQPWRHVLAHSHTSSMGDGWTVFLRHTLTTENSIVETPEIENKTLRKVGVLFEQLLYAVITTKKYLVRGDSPSIFREAPFPASFIQPPEIPI